MGGEAARRGSLVKSFYDVFNISGDPSVSAAHCQLPFQGSLIFLIFSSWKVPFATSHRDLAKILLFLSGFTRGAVLFAPRKKLPLFVPFSVRQKHGAESFAVCGRRLRGHVPSKNTSPTALSWISLFGSHECGAFLSLHDGFCVLFDKITGRDGVCYGLLLLRIFLIISSTSCFRCSSCFIAVSMLLMEYTMVE